MATDDDMSFLLGGGEVANDSVVLSTQQEESIQVEQGLTVLPEGELDTGDDTGDERGDDFDFEQQAVTELVAEEDVATGDYLVEHIRPEVSVLVNVANGTPVERPRAVTEDCFVGKYPLSMSKGQRRGIALVFLTQLEKNLEPYFEDDRRLLIPKSSVGKVVELSTATVQQAARQAFVQIAGALKKYISLDEARAWLNAAFNVSVFTEDTNEAVELIVGGDAVIVTRKKIVVRVNVLHDILSVPEDNEAANSLIVKLQRIQRAIALCNRRAKTVVQYNAVDLVNGLMTKDAAMLALLQHLAENGSSTDGSVVSVTYNPVE